eukprot:8385931-Prorocentrum_lima.AAC.1
MKGSCQTRPRPSTLPLDGVTLASATSACRLTDTRSSPTAGCRSWCRAVMPPWRQPLDRYLILGR